MPKIVWPPQPYMPDRGWKLKLRERFVLWLYRSIRRSLTDLIKVEWDWNYPPPEGNRSAPTMVLITSLDDGKGTIITRHHMSPHIARALCQTGLEQADIQLKAWQEYWREKDLDAEPDDHLDTDA